MNIPGYSPSPEGISHFPVGVKGKKEIVFSGTNYNSMTIWLLSISAVLDLGDTREQRTLVCSHGLMVQQGKRTAGTAVVQKPHKQHNGKSQAAVPIAGSEMERNQVLRNTTSHAYPVQYH